MPRAAALLLALLALVLVPAGGSPRAAEPVILTVTGSVAEANRPPADPFEDVLFNVLQESFDSAHTFTRSELLALPQHTLTVGYPDWPRAVTVRGPRLLEVLAQAGAAGARVVVQAVDGYAPEFAMADLTQDFVLALEAQGKPLAVGGRGPLWLVFPPDSYAGHDSSTDAGLAWAVFHIKVLEE